MIIHWVPVETFACICRIWPLQMMLSVTFVIIHSVNPSSLRLIHIGTFMLKLLIKGAPP
uniref:Uncharacterized protein n=1 Tax=Arundo donax TaxID=35708 RepID=A0A0A9GAR9_ARUDO